MVDTKSRGYSNSGRFSEGKYLMPFFSTCHSPTRNGLIYLKAVDIKPRTQQIQYVYNIFYTAFITKEDFQIFGEMVQKVLKMTKYNLFFCQICLHVD